MLDNGLTRIFAPKQPTKNEFPWDLKADARQLYHRWYNEIFSVDLLRGIVLARAKNKADKRNADRIDPEWPHRVSAKYYGHGDLVMGQWWPTQLCTMRDGAHGSAQGGISGDKGKGAYSIVLSGGHNYSDEDSGEDIWYAGTEGKDFLPTENTLRMIESCDVIKEPVRVIRSHNLDKSNPYRPKGGFRYDGLYDVVAKEVLDEEKAMYRFRLIRRGGQDPIRYEDNATRRPTQNELAEYEKLSSEREVVMID
ncbi:hypothetical protein CC78DRAFT_475257 [Lojkania enalia]|uniref:YDG domain-containing protein n=1 Tax=Lojkania enalia TaxID=147567 RepID=A0A9P4K3M2_9PLEO|nr:hypothetical protein CC78DRAFT_475257 [Didymosphaeria enalia]